MNSPIWPLLGLLCAAQSAAAAAETQEVFTLLDGLYVCGESPALLESGNVYHLTVYHSYPTPLHRFRVDGVREGLTLRVEPPEVPTLKIGEFREFDVHVTPIPNARLAGDRVTVPLSFSADELASDQTWPLVIPLTSAAEQELREADTMPIGSVEVRVRWWAGWETWAYAIGSAVILAALAWRWRRGR